MFANGFPSGSLMVGMAGYEPTTPCSRSKYSTRLSHIPTYQSIYRQRAPNRESENGKPPSGCPHGDGEYSSSASKRKRFGPAKKKAGSPPPFLLMAARWLPRGRHRGSPSPVRALYVFTDALLFTLPRSGSLLRRDRFCRDLRVLPRAWAADRPAA